MKYCADTLRFYSYNFGPEFCGWMLKCCNDHIFHTNPLQRAVFSPTKVTRNFTFNWPGVRLQVVF